MAAIAADALLLGFILLRRAYRKRYFAKRDACVFEFRQDWDALISGKIPFEHWRQKPFRRRVVEEIALDAFESAGPDESARLLKFLRASGLIEKRIFEARRHRGWRRHRALVALGRTRAPEGIPALAEGLRDRDSEIQLAALRGLGRMACPEAAAEILAWVGEAGLKVPPLPLQNALIQCAAERPQLLIPYLQHAEGPVREVLGRVLGEVASPAMGMELLQFADDNLDELRAAAARGLSHAQSGLALVALSELAQDKVWFVRLRAIISLGKLHQRGAIPALLRGLSDSNRLVRLRAAEGLVEFHTDMVQVFEQAVATRDRYGLHAFLTAVENADLRHKIESEIASCTHIKEEEKHQLLEVLLTGKLPSPQPDSAEISAAGRAHAP
ncbi:MAG TPA: HEAT repeat domain-containing protein [Candidatus Acidoferrales bacterium]|nr:HEAT repeat domain-containing protein [Candidatus Acidoferrales bacterium]